MTDTTKPDTSVEAVERLACAVIVGSSFPDAGHLLRQLRKELTEAQEKQRKGTQPTAPEDPRLSAIRAALEAAEGACRDKAAEISTKRPDGRAQHFMGAQVGALSCADSIRNLSPDDILKRL